MNLFCNYAFKNITIMAIEALDNPVVLRTFCGRVVYAKCEA